MTTRKQILVQQLISAALFVAIVIGLGWLSVRYPVQFDWTAGHRNSLTEASRKQLTAMKDPIRFLVFMYPRAEERPSIEADLRKYQRVRKDIKVDFIDPATHPQQVRDYNVSHAGEVVLEYQGRHESLTGTTEEQITSALQRLAYGGERWVVFLQGHGERGIDDNDPQGLAQYAQLLKDKGLKVRGLNLVSDPKVPDNTAVLVIASPGKPLLAGEAKLIDDFAQAGGNILWMADPENDPGLAPLAKTLSLTWQKGMAILPEAAALGLPPYVYVTTQYPENPVTKGFDDNVLLPLVGAFTYAADKGFQVKPLLTTTDQAWLETGKLEGELQKDGKDVAGPLTIGATFTRSVKAADGKGADRPQRIAVIADSDFVSNQYLGQLGNSVLGLNLAQWLATRDEQLNIDVPKAPDRELLLPVWVMYGIYLFFAFLLPAGLLGFGVTRWVVRRRR